MPASIPTIDSVDERRLSKRLVDLVLGSDPEPAPAPERMRDEYLVRFLFLVLPLIVLSSVVDFFLGYSPFSWSLLLTGGLIAHVFGLLRRGLREEGMDVFFFGSVLLLSSGYFAGRVLLMEEESVLPLIFVLQFAALAIYGLYASNALRLRLVFALIALFDIAEFAFLAERQAAVFVTRVGVLSLHLAAYGFAVFLRTYFDRLHKVAEARRVMNRRLEELVSRARESGTQRLASFSHDIRSPITGILGVHDLLASTKLDAEQRSYLAILAKSNRLLLEMVESTLDGGPTAEAPGGPAELRAFLDDALAPYRETARSRGIELKRRVRGSPPPIPLARVEAARVVGNLVDNALKYIESGTILVSVHAEGEGGAVLTVEDTGKGMSAERLAAVRAGSAGADEGFAGSRGLGLSGVRRIAEAAGAELTVESEIGRGTRVRVRFPLPEDAPSGILAGTNA